MKGFPKSPKRPKSMQGRNSWGRSRVRRDTHSYYPMGLEYLYTYICHTFEPNIPVPWSIWDVIQSSRIKWTRTSLFPTPLARWRTLPCDQVWRRLCEVILRLEKMNWGQLRGKIPLQITMTQGKTPTSCHSIFFGRSGSSVGSHDGCSKAGGGGCCLGGSTNPPALTYTPPGRNKGLMIRACSPLGFPSIRPKMKPLFQRQYVRGGGCRLTVLHSRASWKSICSWGKAGVMQEVIDIILKKNNAQLSCQIPGRKKVSDY